MNLDIKDLTPEEVEIYRAAAKRDIGQARGWINMMATGLRQFSFFEPSTPEEEKIATMVQMLNEYADEDGIMLIAATAIVRVAELDDSPLVDLDPSE